MSEASIIAIVSAVSVIAGLIGAAVSQIVAGKLKSNALEAGTEENLRREMSLRLVSQDTKIDLLTAAATSWQDKFYGIQLKQGIMEAENERLSERVTELEKVRDSLIIKISDFEKERLVLQTRIAALEAERLTLLNRITILESALSALRGVPVNGRAIERAEAVEATRIADGLVSEGDGNATKEAKANREAT
jgi:chromosome segregation ATPase